MNFETILVILISLAHSVWTLRCHCDDSGGPDIQNARRRFERLLDRGREDPKLKNVPELKCNQFQECEVLDSPLLTTEENFTPKCMKFQWESNVTNKIVYLQHCFYWPVVSIYSRKRSSCAKSDELLVY